MRSDPGCRRTNRFEIYLLNCCADATRMVKEVNHPNFRMMYDTFHANIEEKNITAALSGWRGRHDPRPHFRE